MQRACLVSGASHALTMDVRMKYFHGLLSCTLTEDPVTIDVDLYLDLKTIVIRVVKRKSPVHRKY